MEGDASPRGGIVKAEAYLIVTVLAHLLHKTCVGDCGCYPDSDHSADDEDGGNEQYRQENAPTLHARSMPVSRPWVKCIFTEDGCGPIAPRAPRSFGAADRSE